MALYNALLPMILVGVDKTSIRCIPVIDKEYTVIHGCTEGGMKISIIANGIISVSDCLSIISMFSLSTNASIEDNHHD